MHKSSWLSLLFYSETVSCNLDLFYDLKHNKNDYSYMISYCWYRLPLLAAPSTGTVAARIDAHKNSNRGSAWRIYRGRVTHFARDSQCGVDCIHYAAPWERQTAKLRVLNKKVRSFSKRGDMVTVRPSSQSSSHFGVSVQQRGRGGKAGVMATSSCCGSNLC